MLFQHRIPTPPPRPSPMFDVVTNFDQAMLTCHIHLTSSFLFSSENSGCYQVLNYLHYKLYYSTNHSYRDAGRYYSVHTYYYYTLKLHLVAALMSSTLTPSPISVSVSPFSKSTVNTPCTTNIDNIVLKFNFIVTLLWYTDD